MSWIESTLGTVARWSSGGTPLARNSAYYDGPIPWAVIGDLNDGVVSRTRSSITEAGLSNSSAKVVPPGTILLAMYGSIGKLGVAGVPMATNQAIATAQVHDCLEPRYLFYYLLSQRRALDHAGKGATQRNISQSVLKPWPIRYPRSRVEQRRIVAVLDDHLSRLDAAEAGIRAGAGRLDVLRRSTLSSVRRALSEAPTAALGELAETSLGKMLDAKRQRGRPVPYLRNVNVRWGSFDLSDVRSTLLTDEEAIRLTVRPDDVMVCEGGEPGRCAVWDEDPARSVAFQKALHRVRVRQPSTILPQFLCLMLTETIQSGKADRLFTGTTIKHLPQEKLRLVEVPIPSLKMQELAIARVSELDDAVDTLRSELSRQRLRAANLRWSLLAAAFSGRLTHLDPPEELTSA